MSASSEILLPFPPDNSSLELLLLKWLEDSYPSQGFAVNEHNGFIFIYAFSVLLSITGNSVAIIITTQSLRRQSHIALYQLNLSVADLFMSLFCVPFTFAQAHTGYWAVGRALCPVVLFLQLCFVNVSAYTNMAIGIDRFCGVMFPLKWKPTGNQRRAIIVGVWSLSAIIALPEVVVGRSVPQDMGNVTQELCNEYWSGEGQKEIYTLVVFLLVLLIPLVTLGITYSCVVFTLWVRETPGNADIRRDRKRLASKKKVTRMLIIVVVMFGVCWLPLHLFNLILDFWPDLVFFSNEQLLQVVFFACHWVAMSHAFVNPIIYVVADGDFREKAVKLLTCRNQICIRNRRNLIPSSDFRQSLTHRFHSKRHRTDHGGQTSSKEKDVGRKRSRFFLLDSGSKILVRRTSSEQGRQSLHSTSTGSSGLLDHQPLSAAATLSLPKLQEMSLHESYDDVGKT